MAELLVKRESPLLEKVMKGALDEFASARTKKYFIKDVNMGYEDYLRNVILTIEALRGNKGSSIVTTSGDVYDVKEYLVPEKLHNYVNSGIIYASIDASTRKQPILQAKKTEATLSPLQFNGFFTQYNSNQIEEMKIRVKEYTRAIATLEDVQYLEDKNNRMVKFHESGYDLETCALLGLSLFNEEVLNFFTIYEMPTEEGFMEWLFK